MWSIPNRHIPVSRILTAALVALAALATTVSISGFFLFPDKTDLWARYLEGAAWLAGTPLYQPVPSVNMFPPSVTMLVFAPMARGPFWLAQALCVALNLVALAASVRAIARELALPERQIVVMSAVLLALHGMYQSWMLGQFTGVLLFLVTRSWIAYRGERLEASGAWLAPLIATKPTFAVIALLLPARVWIVAGLLSMALTVAGVAATGVDVWRQWLAAGSNVTWLAFPFNASVWGMAARWQPGKTRDASITDLHPGWILAVVAAIAALSLHAWTRRQADTRFNYAVMVSILASPLGWIYYIPLLAGPAMATWPQSLGAAAACAALMSPMIGRLHGAGPVLGSMYFAGLMGAWLAWNRTRPKTAR